MANLNKVMLIGRLTRDPEIRTFANGGKVAAIGFAVNNRRKNAQSGQWEDDPVYLDMEAFNRREGQQLADLVENSLRKGHQVFIEGHLKLDQWTDKENRKAAPRSRSWSITCSFWKRARATLEAWEAAHEWPLQRRAVRTHAARGE